MGQHILPRTALASRPGAYLRLGRMKMEDREWRMAMMGGALVSTRAKGQKRE
jgi:hypothetical protein